MTVGEHPAEAVLREVRRRRVGRVAVAYVAVAWAVVEGARAFLPGSDAPDWAFRAILGAASMGFPLAMVLAWDFDITDRGIVRTLDEEDGPAPLPARPRGPWLAFVGLWVVVALLLRWRLWG